MKTSKDFIKKNAPVTWAVITKEGIVMECDFLNKGYAEDFKNNAYCGYYKNCKVKCIQKRNTTQIKTL